MKDRILNILISIDQTIYSFITLGGASPDETMSAAAYRLEQQGRWQGKLFRPVIDAVFFFDAYHCQSSFGSEINRTQLHDYYKKG